jgi:hypothetical protein
MRPALPLLLTCSLLLPASAARAVEPSLAELLQRLAASDAARVEREGRIPVVVVTYTEELDAQGNVAGRRERVTHQVGRGGHARTRLLRERENGRDVTAQRRAALERLWAEHAREVAQSREPSELQTPFAAALQPHYRYTWLGPLPGAPARGQVRFEPLEPSRERLSGVATVDLEHGELLVLEADVSKLPALADFMRLRATYGGSPGARELTTLTREAAGGVLFLREHKRSVATYTSEREPPAAGATR